MKEKVLDCGDSWQVVRSLERMIGLACRPAGRQLDDKDCDGGEGLWGYSRVYAGGGGERPSIALSSEAEADGDGERVQIHTTHTIPAICDELQPQTKPQVTPPGGASDDAEVRKVPLTEVFSFGPPLQHGYGYGHWHW